MNANLDDRIHALKDMGFVKGGDGWMNGNIVRFLSGVCVETDGNLTIDWETQSKIIGTSDIANIHTLESFICTKGLILTNDAQVIVELARLKERRLCQKILSDERDILVTQVQVLRLESKLRDLAQEKFLKALLLKDLIEVMDREDRDYGQYQRERASKEIHDP